MYLSKILRVGLLVGLLVKGAYSHAADLFPDGTPISPWFGDVGLPGSVASLKKYVVTSYGVSKDSTKLQTKQIQDVIDLAEKNGGGVVVIPKGVYLSGALFFKPKTHLRVDEGGRLKGSDDIANYPKLPSRMEGQNLDYFAALVNAYGVDGFTISGKGTIDGNGYKYWEAFWQRRKENPECTNLEVSRPRLLFIWNCNDVQVRDVRLLNSGFWTSHYYRCNNVKVINVHIFAPHKEYKAPSSDAIDLDVCNNVLIKGCYMSVNDDAVALKGGKGPWADTAGGNGPNTNILIEDCTFGFSHSALTCGSEAIHNKNVLMRNCKVVDAKRLLWLKLRPDTPQEYEYITVENITGQAFTLIYAMPWKQFFDLKGRKDLLPSNCDHITLKNIKLDCDKFLDINIGDNDRLNNFSFEGLDITAKDADFNREAMQQATFKNVVVNGTEIR
ncbi:MAG: glycosyl hydrolase family 28 protein [Edaphocola sp.]